MNSLYLFSRYNGKSIVNNISRGFKYRKRKPIYLPLATNKLYSIPEPTKSTKEELDLLNELYPKYRIQANAIREHLKVEHEKSTDQTYIIAQKKARDEVLHQKLMEENRQENERVKQIREQYMQQYLAEYDARCQAADLIQQEYYQDKLQEAEEKVRQEKAISSSYITLDNLDSAIEYAMDNTTNYNYYINKDGKIFWEAGGPPDLSPKTF